MTTRTTCRSDDRCIIINGAEAGSSRAICFLWLQMKREDLVAGLPFCFKPVGLHEFLLQLLYGGGSRSLLVKYAVYGIGYRHVNVETFVYLVDAGR